MSHQVIKRLFSITDAYMLEFARVLRLIFIEDQPAFSAKDSNFSPPFETEWLTVIETAENEPTDELRKDQLRQLTETVLQKMTDCRDNFQDAKRYIKKAFPDNKIIWDEFGFNDYDSVERKQPEMIQFMKRFHNTALKYASELAQPNVNFDAVKVAEILARHNALNDANNAQEKFKKELPVHTQNRINKMNAVWNICTDVCDVGKSIFKNNPAKYHQYLLPPSEEKPDVLNLRGTVVSAATGLPVQGVTVSISEIADITATSDSNGKWGFAKVAAGTYTLNFAHSDYQPRSEAGVEVAQGETTELEVQLTPAAATGIVAGTVMQGAMPVQNARVEADGFPALFANTDINGNYSIANIPAGARTIRATLPPPSPMLPQTQNVNVATGVQTEVNFVF